MINHEDNNHFGPWITASLDTSEPGDLEATIAVSHAPHICELGRIKEKLVEVHAGLHITSSLLGVPINEQMHEEVLDQMEQCQKMARRALTGLWN